MDSYPWGSDDPRGYRNAMGRYKTTRERTFLDRHLPGTPTRLLDIGGGVGRFALPLALAGHKVTVVEQSVEAASVLEEQAAGRLDVIVGDFLGLDLEPTFDAAIAIESLVYFNREDPQDVFARVSSALEPGGLFVFTMLNHDGWRAVAKRRLLGGRNLDYLYTCPRRTEAALAAAGFEVLAMEGFMWLPVGVTSDSRAVRPLALIERALRLRRFISRSPWFLVAARKSR
ncbi:MAG: class I SAM-dependent methyltransferase [Actinomycetota bacterium]